MNKRPMPTDADLRDLHGWKPSDFISRDLAALDVRGALETLETVCYAPPHREALAEIRVALNMARDYAEVRCGSRKHRAIIAARHGVPADASLDDLRRITGGHLDSATHTLEVLP